MRAAFNGLSIDGTVVIGEGERDEAPMLYIGEKVGHRAGRQVDIALDPLEGTTSDRQGHGQCAGGDGDGRTRRALLHAPDIYMDKIAIGGGLSEGVDRSGCRAGRQSSMHLAKAKGVKPRDIIACILDRPRHEELIAKVRKAGAAVKLITDGDVAGVIATAEPDHRRRHLYRPGGAPEGVLAAAALRCIGGQMQGAPGVQAKKTKSAAPSASASRISTANTP